LPRKCRTREHILADLSVHHLEGHVLRCGWVVERMTHDYGIDFQLVTFNRAGEIQEGKVLLQLKASNRLRVRPGQSTLAFRIDRRDLALWLRQLLPVVLIVYDGRKDVAYWLYVQSYFRRLPGFNLFAAGQTVTVHVPTGNVVTPVAVRRFGRFRDQVIRQTREVIHEEEANDPLR
jgi:uncharacterized protein DUF4365